MALRCLRGGSYLDLGVTFGVPASTLYNALGEAVDAVSARTVINNAFGHQDPTRRQQTASGFQQSPRSPFENVLGAVGGIAICRTCPWRAIFLSLQITTHARDFSLGTPRRCDMPIISSFG